MDREFAMQHASRAAKYQLGGAAIGGAVGYGVTGSLNGALMGASFGMMGGSLAAHFTVACFTAGTPLVVDLDGNSRPIELIEVGLDSKPLDLHFSVSPCLCVPDALPHHKNKNLTQRQKATESSMSQVALREIV